MIHLTRLSHRPFVLNCDLIESIETTPDTVISLTTGQKLLVCETPDEIIQSVRQFKRSIMKPSFTLPNCDDGDDCGRPKGKAPEAAEGDENG